MPADARRQAATRARRYFNLALGYHVPPILLFTAGLMGIGKTTLASALSEVLDAVLLRSDVIRKQLAGNRPDRPGREAFGEGLYAPEMSALTYRKMHRCAQQALARGKTVIVDASFTRADRPSGFSSNWRSTLQRQARLLHCSATGRSTLARLDSAPGGGPGCLGRAP